jgi:ribosomal protein L11 methyltransferase
VLIPLSAAIAGRVGPGGQLILSGILIELADGVEQAYRERGLATTARIDQEGWRALVMRAPAAS